MTVICTGSDFNQAILNARKQDCSGKQGRTRRKNSPIEHQVHQNQFFLLLFTSLYPSNQITETNAVTIVHPICIPFNEVILKNDEKEGMYRIIASNASVAIITILNRIFLFLNVANTERENERFTNVKKMFAKISVVNTIDRVISSLYPF